MVHNFIYNAFMQHALHRTWSDQIPWNLKRTRSSMPLIEVERGSQQGQMTRSSGSLPAWTCPLLYHLVRLVRNGHGGVSYNELRINLTMSSDATADHVIRTNLDRWSHSASSHKHIDHPYITKKVIWYQTGIITIRYSKRPLKSKTHLSRSQTCWLIRLHRGNLYETYIEELIVDVF